MKKQLPITIWLKPTNSLNSTIEYQITRINGAVTVWNPVLRLGDIVSEPLARQLARSYRVTVK